jgi:hypothetical protein
MQDRVGSICKASCFYAALGGRKRPLIIEVRMVKFARCSSALSSNERKYTCSRSLLTSQASHKYTCSRSLAKVYLLEKSRKR